MGEPIKIQVHTGNGQRHSLWSLAGKNLWEVLTLAGFPTDGTCSGRGSCGKCKVQVTGQVSSMKEPERNFLLPDEFNRGERLACQCTILGPASVSLPGIYDIKSGNYAPLMNPNPDVNRVSYRRVLLPGLDPETPMAIHRRLKTALGETELHVPLSSLERLSRIDRQGRPVLDLTALLLDGQAVEVARERPSAYGLVLDLGSTSLLAALIDMSNGDIAAVSSQPNLQRVYGADIISRISYCMENSDGQSNLHQILINNVNSMIEDLLMTSGAEAEDVYETIIVGNPVMLHLFINLSVAGLASYPYHGLFVDELVLPASSINLCVNQLGKLILLPQAGGYIGADTVSCLLTIPDWSKSSFILIDIGTNGEVVVGNRGELWAASAAAGPALEGGHIRCGMRAAEGAIDKVIFNEGEGLTFRVIGETLPRGLCGSAIIDTTAAMLKAGWIDEYGTVTPKGLTEAAIQPGGSGDEIVISVSQEGSQPAVVFTQEDIRQVQLAKSAIRTAVDLLMEQAGLAPDDIQQIYLAGAFGHYLNPASIIGIGLIPKFNLDLIRPIGNAAASGAIAALLSPTKRREASKIQGQIKLVELAEHPDFQDRFLQNLNF